MSILSHPLYCLRLFDNGVVDGTIFGALAATGRITFCLIDHTDLIQIVDRFLLTKMNTGPTPNALFNYDYVWHIAAFQDITACLIISKLLKCFIALESDHENYLIYAVLCKNSWIEDAAFLPAPMALITVAAPVAISPPAQ